MPRKSKFDKIAERIGKSIRRFIIFVFVGAVLWTTLQGVEVSANYNAEKAKQSWTRHIGTGLSWYQKIKGWF